MFLSYSAQKSLNKRELILRFIIIKVSVSSGKTHLIEATLQSLPQRRSSIISLSEIDGQKIGKHRSIERSLVLQDCFSYPYEALNVVWLML